MIRFIVFILLIVNTDFCISPVSAQSGVYHIIDFVEMPAELNIHSDPNCFIEFREQWTFLSKGGLIKEVIGYDLSCSQENKDLTLPEGTTRIKNISYEFILLDPHLVESGNNSFSGPDSMDIHSKRLQADLIELIHTRAPFNPRYEPRQQLLSVYFHEEWILGPDSMQISKKVTGITPVIWQRRQTAEGRAIDEGDSGLPVYYKNPLQKVSLRLP